MRKAIRIKAPERKEKTRKPLVEAEPFYRTREYFELTDKLAKIVLDTFPEGRKFSKKEKIERVEWRKRLLTDELKIIQKSMLSSAAKKDLREKYNKWIKQYDKILKNIKEEK